MINGKRRSFFVALFLNILLCLFFILFPQYAQGATYYVSTSTTSDNSNDGLTESAAWRTIAYACSEVKAGNTVLIKAGNYGNEQAIVANTGTSNLPITIKAEIPGTVLLTGLGTGDGLFISNKNHINIEGITFSNYSSGLVIKYKSTYVTVKKCIFNENNNFGLLLYGNINTPSDSHHHLFTENQFYDHTDQQDYGIALYFSTDVKAINNYFFGKHHQALSFKKKMYNSVASNNIFEGFLYSALYLGQNLDNLGGEGILRCYNLIAEGNIFRPAAGYRAKTPIWVANVTGAVVRNNFMEGKSDVDGGWGQGIAIGDGSGVYAVAEDVNIYNNVFRNIGGTTANPGIRVYWDCKNVKVYNNTFVDCAYALGFEYYASLVFKNNIFYNNTGIIRGSDSSDARNCIFEYNDFFPDWPGKWAMDISVEPKFDGVFTPIVLKAENPMFIPDYSRSEVCRLKSDSPCIDKGDYLTHTVSSGVGTNISVEDAGYFIDGFGIVQGDLIQVGLNNPVRITSIDYNNKVITVEQNITWNNNDGVSFPYSALLPDMGAYEYGLSIGTILPKITYFYPTDYILYQNVDTINSFRVSVDQEVTSQWYLDNIQQPGITTNYIKTWNYADTGNHSIIYKGQNDNGIVSKMWNVIVLSDKAEKVTIAPNPYIKGKSSEEKITFTNLSKEATIKIYCLSGELIKTIKHKDIAEGGSEKWDVSGIASGVYIYYIESSGREMRGKVTIIK